MNKYLLLLFVILVTQVSSCKHSKEELYKCVIKVDLNKDNQISKQEIKELFNVKLNWYEKLIYPIDWVISQFEKDCGLPLTKNNLLNKVTCFRSCIYRDTLIDKLC